MQRVHWTLPIYIYIFVLTFGEVQIMDLLYVVFGPFTTKKKLKDVGRRRGGHHIHYIHHPYCYAYVCNFMFKEEEKIGELTLKQLTESNYRPR